MLTDTESPAGSGLIPEKGAEPTPPAAVGKPALTGTLLTAGISAEATDSIESLAAEDSGGGAAWCSGGTWPPLPRDNGDDATVGTPPTGPSPSEAGGRGFRKPPLPALSLHHSLDRVDEQQVVL